MRVNKPLLIALSLFVTVGCGGSGSSAADNVTGLYDGTYQVSGKSPLRVKMDLHQPAGNTNVVGYAVIDYNSQTYAGTVSGSFIAGDLEATITAGSVSVSIQALEELGSMSGNLSGTVTAPFTSTATSQTPLNLVGANTISWKTTSPSTTGTLVVMISAGGRVTPLSGTLPSGEAATTATATTAVYVGNTAEFALTSGTSIDTFVYDGTNLYLTYTTKTLTQPQTGTFTVTTS